MCIRDSRYTLPVGLQLLEQLGRSDYPLLMAGAVWATLAPLALVVVAALAVALVERQHVGRVGNPPLQPPHTNPLLQPKPSDDAP